MKNILSRLIACLVIVLIGFLTGCIVNDKTIPTVEDIVKELDENGIAPIKPDIFVWLDYDMPSCEELTELFAVENPEYTINIVSVQPMVLSRVISAVQSGTQPDAFNVQSNWPAYYFSDAIFPLQVFIDRDDEFLMEDINELVVENNSINGSMYTISPEIFVYCMAWNRTTFAEFGLNPDRAPATWSELLEYQNIMTSLDSKSILSRVGYLCPMPYEKIAAMLDGKSTVSSNFYDFDWNRPAIIQVVEFSKTLERIYGGMKSINFRTAVEAASLEDENITYTDVFAFEKGNVSMVLLDRAPWWDDSIDYGIGAFPMPDDMDKTYTVAAQSDYLMLANGAKNLRGGWTFIKWMLTSGFVNFVDAKRFDSNPFVYIAPYHTLSYMRNFLSNLYSEEFEEFELVNYTPIRDEIASNINAFYRESAITDDIDVDRILTENKTALDDSLVSIRETLSETQSLLNIISEDWKQQMEIKGWNFSGN